VANSITTLPSRCSLYQALLWIAEEVPPIEDLIFDSLPEPTWVPLEDKHKRELLVALRTGGPKSGRRSVGSSWAPI
jgi:hypothetical protein